MCLLLVLCCPISAAEGWLSAITTNNYRFATLSRAAQRLVSVRTLSACHEHDSIFKTVGQQLRAWASDCMLGLEIGKLGCLSWFDFADGSRLTTYLCTYARNVYTMVSEAYELACIYGSRMPWTGSMLCRPRE